MCDKNKLDILDFWQFCERSTILKFSFLDHVTQRGKLPTEIYSWLGKKFSVERML